MLEQVWVLWEDHDEGVDVLIGVFRSIDAIMAYIRTMVPAAIPVEPEQGWLQFDLPGEDTEKRWDSQEWCYLQDLDARQYDLDVEAQAPFLKHKKADPKTILPDNLVLCSKIGDGA